MIQTLIVGPFEVNCYIAWDDQTGDAAIIDPGADDQHIIRAIERAKCTPRGILLTHGHGDHIGSVGTIKDHFEIPLYVGAGEERFLEDAEINLSAWFGVPVVTPAPDVVLKDEDTVSLGSLRFVTLATPGHTPGSISYLYEREGIIFVGDVLFQGSVGRTDFPGCSHDRLMESIRTKIMTLPDSVVCYPGHGPRTTVGAERRSNPFLIGEYFA